MKSNAIILITLTLAVLAAGCVQTSLQEEITQITIPGHPVYTFSNDVRDALKVPSPNSDLIRRLIIDNRHITVVFDASSETDNGSFNVAAFNTITKIQTYFVYEGLVKDVDSVYYIGDEWFGKVNDTYKKIDRPQFNNTTVMWFKGPNTGANVTALTADGNIIYIQGTSHKNITLVSDKLSLVVLGVEKV